MTIAALAIAAAGPSPSSATHGKHCGVPASWGSSPPGWARKRKMTVLVDSVLLGAFPALHANMPCWRTRKLGKPALMIKAAERDLRSRGRRVAPLVVVGLGYNSLWERHRGRYRRWARIFDRNARRLIRTLRRLGARQIVWVTLRQPTARTVPPHARGELSQYSWYFPYVNERLRRLDRRLHGVAVADWRKASNRRGLTYDSIHVNPRGARRMALTIEKTLRRESRRQQAQ